MALSLACPCGSRFAVEETFAGQAVTCPDCQRSLKAPLPGRVTLRTSGYAIASVVLALAGALTLVGTVAAVVVGAFALVSIARNRDRVTGAGYAVFGIVAGLVFTAVALLAYSRGELFGVGGWLRDKTFLAGQVDYSGPREVIREKDGFAITRPSDRWGVAKRTLPEQWDIDCTLLLVNPAHDAYVSVTGPTAGLTLEEYQELILDVYREQDKGGGKKSALRRTSGLKVREQRRLPSVDGIDVSELLLDVRVQGQPFTFLYRFFREQRSGRLYCLQAWVSRRRFATLEGELRLVLDSFRLLGPH